MRKLVLLLPFVIMACSQSKEEKALREKQFKDSLKSALDASISNALDSLKLKK